MSPTFSLRQEILSQSQFKSVLGAQLAINLDFKGIKKYKNNCCHVWSEHCHGDSYITSRIYHRLQAKVFGYFLTFKGYL